MKVKDLLKLLPTLDPEAEIFLGSSFGRGENGLENWELYSLSLYYRSKLNSLRSGSHLSLLREEASLIVSSDLEIPPLDNPLGEDK